MMQDPQIKEHVQQRRPQFPEQEHLKCPRCDSNNTKFCYFNNYNLSQPRHFCKSCKRYWTKGGNLRNIPVGGGSRKNIRRSSSASRPSTKRRPAASASVSASDHMNDSKSNNGEMTETLPLKGEIYAGQFGNFLEVSGSFSSLLVPGEGQYSNLQDFLGNNANGSNFQTSAHFGDPGSVQNVNPQVGLETGSSINNADEFLNIEGGGGDTGWSVDSNGLPDLAIYTPGPTFP